MYAGSWIRSGLCLWLAGTAACLEAEPLTEGSLTGTVYLSRPVDGATVHAHFLDEQGEVISSTVPIMTSADGRFTFDLGTRYGRVLLVATGGQAVDMATGEAVAVDTELRAVLPRYHPAYPSEVVITPLTTLATALGEQRYQRGDKEPTYLDAMEIAYRLVSEHAGGFDLVHTLPHDAGESAVAQDERRVYHGLVLAGLSSLAARIARESNLSPRSLHTGHLLVVLIADATSSEALFDGMGADEQRLRIGTCPPPLDCPPGETCPTICDLDENTLRADLATALAFDFMPSAQNGTGWTFEDVQPLVETMRTNAEPELFGPNAAETIEELGGELPSIRIVPSTIHDESRDLIEFSPYAVPMHIATADVELGEGTSCPTVYKHTSRLDDPEDNPVRWVFEVLDQRGAAIRPEAGAYRVRLRGEDDWLTEWRPATSVASVAGGVQYEVVLLREDMPELGTVQGIFEIAFRGQDVLGASVASQRCWEHVPLAPPLDIGATVESTGPGSMRDAVGLEPGKILGPLLNGVPLEQGAALLETTLRNGTDEPVYLSLNYEQPVVTGTKDWILTSAFLYDDATVVGCLNQGTCPDEWPAHLSTVDPPSVPIGIAALIGGLRVWDVTMGTPVEIPPCSECSLNEYLIAPRIDPAHPRMIRVAAVVTHLDKLAPTGSGDPPPEFYRDVIIDPEYIPIVVTGHRHEEDDVVFCDRPDFMNGLCRLRQFYSRYRALTSASLSIGEIRISGQTRAGDGLPRRMQTSHDGTIGSLSGLQWMTTESLLPPPHPPGT